MKSSKLLWSLIFSLVFIIIMIMVIDLPTSSVAQAEPMAGFTPSPSPTPLPPDNSPPPQPDSSEDQPPPGYVLAQLSQCDITCVFETAQNGEASVSTAPIEIIVLVKLVHQDSGFIVTGELSTQHSTKFLVPYPGRWEVFLTDQPQFMSNQPTDLNHTNLARLQVNLTNGPISLGIIEANTETPQMVMCPIECVVQATPATHLPETGSNNLSSTIILFITVGLIFAMIGSISWLMISTNSSKMR